MGSSYSSIFVSYRSYPNYFHIKKYQEYEDRNYYNCIDDDYKVDVIMEDLNKTLTFPINYFNLKC